jgi:hypothetical protein
MFAALVLAIFLIVTLNPEEAPTPASPATASPEEAGKIILKRR